MMPLAPIHTPPRRSALAPLLAVAALVVSPLVLAAEGWAPAGRVVSPPVGQAAGGLVVDYELVVDGLDDPVVVTHAGDGSGRLFIVEQEGLIRIYDGAQLLPTPYLDIRNIVLCCGEQGLLGLAFHPQYETNGFFFVDYTNNAGDTVIARYSVSAGDPNVADPASAMVLKTIDQPFTNHNGGNIGFGPDGYLYVGMGDGGSANDPGNRAQNLFELLGKMLRLDVDSPPDYIPPDNPYVGDPNALPEIWAFGLRNPWRWSFDRLTGDLILGDVGQNVWEEVDFQPAASGGGENWGWKVLEGNHCFSDVPAGACDDFLNGGSELPILEYQHTGGSCAVTGGYRYRGSQHANLAGIYFYADYCSGKIWAATEDAPGVWSSQEVFDTTFNISTFGEDEAGEVYFTHLSSFGAVYRLVGTGSSIPCEDIRIVQTRCRANVQGNTLQARVQFFDSSHSGEVVELSFDGVPMAVPVNGSRAQASVNGAAPGPHTIELTDPAGCFAPATVTCP